MLKRVWYQSTAVGIYDHPCIACVTCLCILGITSNVPIKKSCLNSLLQHTCKPAVIWVCNPGLINIGARWRRTFRACSVQMMWLTTYSISYCHCHRISLKISSFNLHTSSQMRVPQQDHHIAGKVLYLSTGQRSHTHTHRPRTVIVWFL